MGAHLAGLEMFYNTLGLVTEGEREQLQFENLGLTQQAQEFSKVYKSLSARAKNEINPRQREAIKQAAEFVAARIRQLQEADVAIQQRLMELDKLSKIAEAAGPAYKEKTQKAIQSVYGNG